MLAPLTRRTALSFPAAAPHRAVPTPRWARAPSLYKTRVQAFRAVSLRTHAVFDSRVERTHRPSAPGRTSGMRTGLKMAVSARGLSPHRAGPQRRPCTKSNIQYSHVVHFLSRLPGLCIRSQKPQSIFRRSQKPQRITRSTCVESLAKLALRNPC